MILFRSFKESDWPNFENIVQEAFARENIRKENFLNMIDDDGLIGAFVEDKLVGYLRMIIMEDYGHLGQIAVEKDERGKGYGNQLMENAIEFFTRHEVKNVGLYVETKNKVAINLYEKYGFAKEFESFHYWIDETQFKDIYDNYQMIDNSEVRILLSDDFEEIIRTFPEVNVEELQTHLKRTKSRGLSGGESFPIGLFVDNSLKVYGRFNPEFPGCRPFEITDVAYVDEFIVGLSEFKTQEYIRLTFDRNKDLSEFCANRGYRLHHHLYLMKKKMIG